MKKIKRNIAAVPAVLLLCLLFSGYAASGITGSTPSRRVPPPPYERVTVYIDGILTDTVAYLQDSRTYISLPAFCEALELEYETLIPEEGEALRLNLLDMTVTAPDSFGYIEANGRCFYLPAVETIRGEDCYPVATLCSLVGASVTWDGHTESIDVDSTYLHPLREADYVYDEDELTWLSRIIDAEAGAESLLGKIAVGNVVMNRAASGAFPDTIYDVIFDTRYGVQFTPIETGTIFNEPRDQSVIAAKICLEGVDVVGASLYFVNPDWGLSSWFRDTRTYVTTIGDHDFYA